MAKKPYRVVYQYPGGKPGRVPHLRLAGAEDLAGEIGRRGGDATLLLVEDAGEQVLARFGPDVLHRWERLTAPADPDSDAVCSCGRVAHTDRLRDETRRHMDAAGQCPECEGTTLVAERATRDGGEPMAGNLIDCPVCQATGLASEVSYWEVDTGKFYSRLQMLRLKREAKDGAQ